MPNKYHEVEPAAAPAQEQDSTFLSGDPIETLVAGAQKVAQGIPGLQSAQDYLLTKLGVPGSFIQQERERLSKEHPAASAAGTVGGLAAGAAALPGVGAVEGAAAKLATGAAQAAMLAPAYKLGETADQAILQSNRLRAEQITHSLFSSDSVVSALLATMLGAPGALLETASPYIQSLAKTQAAKQAAQLFPKAAQSLRLPPGGDIDLGVLALEKGMLENAGAAKRQLKEAGRIIGQAASKAQVEETLRAKLGDTLAKFAATLEGNTAYDSVRKALIKQADAFEVHDFNGNQVEDVIQKLNGAGTKNDRAVYKDAAQHLREVFAQHLDTVDPQAGAAYRAAVDDYHAYAKMAPEAIRGAQKQVTGTQAALRTLLNVGTGGTLALGKKALEAAGYMRPSTSNYANLLDKFAKVPPSANFMLQTGRLLDHLLNPSAAAQMIVKLTPDDLEKRYDEAQHALRLSVVAPDRTAQTLRGQLDFLPPHEADAVAAGVVNRLQAAAVELPQPAAPPTAFGSQLQPSDKEKRAFLEQLHCKFDPYAALASGRPECIAEAEKYNPEVVHYLKGQLISKLNERKDIPYEQKRRLSALLGVAGVPLQDPALAAQLQHIIQTRREADSQAGQMHSARQAAASQKQNKAALTRAQKLLESE